MSNRRSIMVHHPRNFANEFSVYYCNTPSSKEAAQKFERRIADDVNQDTYWITKQQAKKKLAWAREEKAWFSIYVGTNNPEADVYDLYYHFEEADALDEI